MAKTEQEVKKLVTDVTPAEMLDYKRKALDAGITLKKYVRLKLGLDKSEKEKGK